MKKILSLTAILLVSISSVFADAPTIYCELLESNRAFTIKSHIFWNVGYDKTLRIPESYISGNDTEIIRNFNLGKNRLKVKLYFPQKRQGRQLNASTTVHVTMYLNGREIVNTKHFGQHSQDFVSYNTAILYRPNLIKVYVTKNDDVKVRVEGKYIPKSNNGNYPNNEEKASIINYLSTSRIVDDERITKLIIKDNPPSNINNALINEKLENVTKRFSKTKNWSDRNMLLDPKYANDKVVMESIKSLRKSWNNVSIPIIAQYKGTRIGENKIGHPIKQLSFLLFQDSNGETYNFGYGNNNYSDFDLSKNNANYKDKTFIIYWEWKLSGWPAGSSFDDLILIQAYYPSIEKLELVSR